MKLIKSKILIIEHDTVNTELIKRELIKSKINYISETVKTKKEYIKALHTFQPDIILSNYTFPAFDGPAAFKIKEKLSPQTPFIFVCESVGEEIIIELIKSGVTDFVLKDSLSTLCTKLNRALEKASKCKLNTESQQAEKKRVEKLGQNEAKFRAIFENSMDGILLLVTDGEILAANPALCKMLQKTEQEIVNTGKYGLANINDSSFKAFLEQHKRSEKSKAELTLIRNDGTDFFAEISSIDYTDFYNEKITSMIIRDITERKKAEINLKQSEKKYRQIVEMAQEGIWLIDENHKTTFVNKKMGEILEYLPEEMIGKDIYSFMDEEGKKIAFKLMENKKTRHYNQTEFKYISKSGKEIWTNVASNPFTNKIGSYKGSMTMVTDITERKKNKEKLEQLNKELAFQNCEKENRAAELFTSNTELLKTNKELDRFVYSVSHDLRSPLTSILGLISFIEEESRETDTLEHIEMIKSSVSRLDEFIKNILCYSRNNRTGLDIVQIPLQKIATEIVDSLRSIKDAENILFEIDIKEQQPFYSDRLRWNTLLENLISNAIKYHKTNQTDSFIKIIGQSDYNKLSLSITDNGIGIATEHQSKIFDMFFRISGKKNGSGIGLYIVKETVQILQGSIEIYSEEGIGTTFNITLKNLRP